MQVSGALESDKTELSLEIDSFDRPKELTKAAAWSQLILNVIFMKKGTYPSIPDLGIDIRQYDYEFMDVACDKLQADIAYQHQTYLPELPLVGVMVTSQQHKGQPIMLVQLQFQVSKTETETTAIAINTSKRNFLDFDVSWG